MSSIQEHVENTTKNTKNLPRIAVCWLVVVKRGHTGYQIEAKRIFDYNTKRDLSKIPCVMPILATLGTFK